MEAFAKAGYRVDEVDLAQDRRRNRQKSNEAKKARLAVLRCCP
jgi:hypothetical protein